MTKYYSRVGNFLQKSYKYDEALVVYQTSLEFSKSINDPLIMAENLTEMGYTYGLMKSFEKAFEFFNRSLKISKLHGKKMITAWTLAHKSQLGYQNDSFDDVINDLSKALEICTALGNIHCEDYIYNIMGNYYLKIGEFKEALKYQIKSYKMRKKRQNKLEMAYALCSIAGIYSHCGDIKKANHYIEKIFLIQEDFSDNLTNILFKSIKGEILAEQGKIKEASYYLEKALKKLEDFTDLNQRYWSIHFLIWIAIIKVDKKKQNQMLKYIQNLIDFYPNNQNLMLFFKLERGIVFKYSRDTYKELLAKQIFSELTTQKKMKTWIFIELIVHYIEILIREFKYTHKDEILENIEDLSSRLLAIAEKQKLVAVISEALLLKAILAIEKNEISSVRSIFTKAQKIAHEKGLDLLAQKISDEHDNYIDLLDNSARSHNVSLGSKITNFRFVFSKITRNFQFQIILLIPYF